MSSEIKETGFGYFIAYWPFVNIAMGVIGNIATVIILRTDKELKKQSSMVMFSFIGITGQLLLYYLFIKTI